MSQLSTNHLNMASSSNAIAPPMAGSRDVSLHPPLPPPLRLADGQMRRFTGGGESVEESMRQVMFLNCWGLG